MLDLRDSSAMIYNFSIWTLLIISCLSMYLFIGRRLRQSSIDANKITPLSTRCDQILVAVYGENIGSYQFIFGSFITSLLTVFVSTLAIALSLPVWLASHFPESTTSFSTCLTLLAQFYPIVMIYVLIPGLISLIASKLLTAQWRKEPGFITGLLFVFTDLAISLLLFSLFAALFVGLALGYIDTAIQDGFPDAFSENYVVTAAGLGLGSIILTATGAMAILFPTILLWSLALATMIYNLYAKLSGSSNQQMPVATGGVIISILMSLLFLVSQLS